jgi:hypothetical protein
MVKVHLTLSIDDKVIELAKQKGINVSQFVEDALKMKFVESKKYLPESVKVIKCSFCSKEIEEGYFCSERRKVYCSECQTNSLMKLCPPDLFGEHSHIKFPSQNMVKPEI